MEFIDYSHTRKIIALLDEALLCASPDRRILPIVGSEGTGKTTLLKFWSTEHLRKKHGASFELAPILHVEVRQTQRKTSQPRVYVTPSTCVLFSEIVFQLGELAERIGRSSTHNPWYKPTGQLYTDSQFNALFNFVRREFQALQIRGLIIDRADLLDACAFDMLMQWYEYRKRQFALIVCFTLPKNATVDETLKPMYHSIQATLLDEPAEVPTLSRKEFAEYILPGVLDQTGAHKPEDRATQMEIAKRAWETTRGEWKSIDTLARKIRRVIGTKSNQTAELTPSVLKEIFGSWTGAE